MLWTLLWAIPAGLIALLLIVIALFRVWAAIRYDKDGLHMRVGIGPVFFTLLPIGKKKKKLQQNDVKKKEPQKKKHKAKEKVKEKENLNINAILSAIKPIVPQLLHLLTIRRLYVRWKLKCDDAAITAITYGTLTGIISTGYKFADKYLDLRKTDIYVSPEFTDAEGSISFIIKLDTTILRALRVAFKTLMILHRQRII